MTGGKDPDAECTCPSDLSLVMGYAIVTCPVHAPATSDTQANVSQLIRIVGAICGTLMVLAAVAFAVNAVSR